MISKHLPTPVQNDFKKKLEKEIYSSKFGVNLQLCINLIATFPFPSCFSKHDLFYGKLTGL